MNTNNIIFLQLLHESSITGHTLSLLSSTADYDTKGEQQAGSYHASGGEAVLHICTTVGTLGTERETNVIL